MKIATLSKIKNEADIIESFVRYHGKIADEMFFVENGSTDGTLEILQKLRREGYAVTIFDERDHEFDELMFVNKYAEIILQRELYDWLVPIDADEFLYAEGENPRIYMETWNPDVVYTANWRTYIWKPGNSDKDGFVPDSFEEYRHEKHETLVKVIVPGRLYREKRLLISRGNHQVLGIGIETQKAGRITFAHYPIRSEEQFKTQIVINNLMQLSRPKRVKKEAWHWGTMYQKIREQQRIDLEKISLTYGILEGGKIETCKGKMLHGFLGDIPIKYGENGNISAFYNLLCASEKMALQLRQREMAKVPAREKLCRKQIVIYGMGRAAQEYIGAINTERYEITAYVDSSATDRRVQFCEEAVHAPDVLEDEDFDLIVITTGIYFQEIKSELLHKGFKKANICFIAEVLKDGWDQQYHCL